MKSAQLLISLAVVTAASTGVFYLIHPREVDRLREENLQLDRERRELVRVVERLIDEDRVAEVHVIDQVRVGEMLNGRPATRPLTTIEFIELDREEHPLPSRRFVLEDEVIYFDALVVKFEHEAVAADDELRGKSLMLFRRIFGEHQNPADGYLIDPQGDVPDVYRVEPEPTEFEKNLWAGFWNYVTDPELAARDGVRIAQGEAVYAPMARGEIWTLSIQKTGDLNIKLRRTAAGTVPTTRPAGESPLER